MADFSQTPLEGKTGIIVGATSGIGRAVAEQFAAAGATLTLAGRRTGVLQELGETLVRSTGRRAAGVPVNVRDRDQVRAMVEFSRATFSRIDFLVYSTGTNIPDRSIDRLTPETWDMMMATNLTGAFHCTQLVLPVMREQGDGLIVYISSVSAVRPDISGVSYQATKHGLVGLAHGTMQEERRNGIRTSVIFPGLTDTPLLDRRPVRPDPEQMEHALQPEDVAQACLLVAALPPRAHVPELTITPALP